VQNALNEIARRGYTTTYAGAIAVWQYLQYTLLLTLVLALALLRLWF
jgi:hypothetical protein